MIDRSGKGTRRNILILAVTAIMALALAVPAEAAVIPITTTYSGGIAAAITAAGNGGTVILAPGTYYQSGIPVGNSVTVEANASLGGTQYNTIIDAQNRNRIFDMSGSYTLVIDNLTLQNSNAPSDDGMGGAIDANSGGAIFVNSSAISWCQANDDKSANGGAIYVSTGNVYVTSSSFTGCRAGDSASGTGGSGGAIADYNGDVYVTSSSFTGCRAGDATSGGAGRPGGMGGAIYDRNGHLYVTSSSFTGCRAGDAKGDGSGGYGGAIDEFNGDVHVTSSSFTGCRAGVMIGGPGESGMGGAIYVMGGRNSGSTVSFSRLEKNSVFSGSFANEIYSEGTLTATNNWWGSSSAPSLRDINNKVTARPYLVLGITASPSTVTTGGTATISANLTYNSNGADTIGSGMVFNGTPVTFTTTGGTISSATAATDNGRASATFTPSGTGTYTITATVDGQSVSIPVTVVTGGPATTVVVDPDNAETIYAGIDSAGIYHSTDGGNTWIAATMQPGNTHIRTLAINRAATSTLFTGTYGGGVYKSTNRGVTWGACSDAGLSDLNVYALATNSTGALFAGTGNGVFVSMDSCGSWTAMNTGIPA